MERRATHAGSWYSDNAFTLNEELEAYLRTARTQAIASLKAIISPHAGYRYSGATAAWGFKCIDKTMVRRVFVLGPSHHVYLDKCALPPKRCTQYHTPLGKIQLDVEILNELYQTGQFVHFESAQEEAEHSIEMQLPYLVKRMHGQPFTLVPIVVGSVNEKSEALYGRLLARYFDDPGNIFIISSDFCHWGDRFRYFHLRDGRERRGLVYRPDRFPINAGIEVLDRAGMDLITQLDVKAFQRYLSAENNTICGRHPICVFLEMLNNSQTKCNLDFVHYSQSQMMPRHPGSQDSCVSYASGVCVACPV